MKDMLALFGLTIAVAWAILRCSPAVTQSDRDELTRHADMLARCQQVGREAGHYEAYDNCVAANGLRESRDK